MSDAEMQALGITLNTPVAPGSAPSYSLAPTSVQVFERGDDRLVVRVSEDGFVVDWALLEATMFDGDRVEYDLVMHGHGFGTGLREPRHTHFGRDGYIFYVKPRLLIWAFGQLRQWFDFDGDDEK